MTEYNIDDVIQHGSIKHRIKSLHQPIHSYDAQSFPASHMFPQRDQRPHFEAKVTVESLLLYQKEIYIYLEMYQLN